MSLVKYVQADCMFIESNQPAAPQIVVLPKCVFKIKIETLQQLVGFSAGSGGNSAPCERHGRSPPRGKAEV